MIYKMMAIGILALLALSSVMNPKAFRFLSGFLAVAIVTMATGYFVLASYSPTPKSGNQSIVARLISRLKGFVDSPPSFDDATRSTSQRILEGFENDLIATVPIDEIPEVDAPEPTNKQRDRVIVIRKNTKQKLMPAIGTHP